MVATIELFAGAGGIGLGARHAGADVRLSAEIDSAACKTLRANGGHGQVLEEDVSRLSGDDLRSLGGIGPHEPLLITGGPPCQPFSKAAYWTDPGDDARYRRARERGESVAKPAPPPLKPDARRTLVEEYFRLIVEAGADAFVFENVPSIMHPRHRVVLDWLCSSAAEHGFEATLVRANAADFGVPQRRERVLLLGSRKKAPVAPRPSHAEQPVGSLAPYVTAGVALRDVRAPVEPEEIVEGRYAEHLREIPPGWNYKHHTAWAGHPNPSFVTETRFWNFLLKLSPDLPSWTIPANPGPWIGPFHWESRRLRTAELAVLQGFPPDYAFVGSRRERVRQIGNAAPPPLVSAMVRAVIEAMPSRSMRGRARRPAKAPKALQLPLRLGLDARV
jgi:DNA (cytosine-5)-methyltransferase 1